jgi:type II secretory pathway pseudopilin PulG
MLRVLVRRWRSRACASEGFTLLDVIFVVALIGVLSAIAGPILLSSRAAANETASIATMRTVNTGQLAYALSCGLGLWAANFQALADPGGGLGYLPNDMTAVAAPQKSGYAYTLQPGPGGLTALIDCNGNTIALDYYVTAAPLAFGNTGNRAFATSEANVIWQDPTGVAPVQPFTAGGNVSTIQ